VILTGEVVIATQGLRDSLGCTFETIGKSPSIFWYKQQLNDLPRFMLQSSTHGSGINTAEFHKDRFDAQIQNTSVPLSIHNLQLSDSALYYCALKPTVTGNGLPVQKPAEHKTHFPPSLRTVHKHYA
jgi:hypothetical protein